MINATTTTTNTTISTSYPVGYQVMTEMSFDGLNASRFEAAKTELIHVVATSLGLSDSSVELHVKSSSRQKKENAESNEIVVVATITTKELDELEEITKSINSGSFESSINDEIQMSSTLKAMTLTNVSKAIFPNNGEFLFS